MRNSGFDKELTLSNLDAEFNIISSILFDNEILNQFDNELLPDDFYHPLNKIIINVIMLLLQKQSPIDPISIKAELPKEQVTPELENHLLTLTSSLPIVSSLKHHVKILKELSLRRKIIKFAINFSESASNPSQKIENILELAESELFSLSLSSSTREFVKVKDFIIEAAEKIISNQSNKVKGIESGFNSLDKLLGGFQKGDLVILAARPSVGKSSVMLEIARNAAIKSNQNIVIFSLEMSKEQILDRLLSLQSEINLMDIRMGQLTDISAFQNAASELMETDIYIDDTPGLHINEIKSKVRKLNMKHKVDLILVDYLQLVQGSNKDNRALEVTEISQGLKNLAREIGTPVIALSQLNRSLESRADKRPQLSDLRESGSIEQDADIVIFIHREAVFNRDIDEVDKDKAEFIVAKHRNGATGSIPIRFIPEIAKFTDLEVLEV